MNRLTREHPSWPEFERRLRTALAADPCTHRSTNRAVRILFAMDFDGDLEGIMPSVRVASKVSGFAECDCRIVQGNGPEAA